MGNHVAAMFLTRFWKPLAYLAVAGCLWIALFSFGNAKYKAGRADERAGWLVVQAKAERDARAALQAQIDTANTTDKRNEKIIAGLNHQVDDAVGDLSLAGRLLAAARARTSPNRSLHETADQPGTAPASGTSGDGLADSIAAAVGECRRNTARLTALIAEIQPQL
jgi:hypothetical protein